MHMIAVNPNEEFMTRQVLDLNDADLFHIMFPTNEESEQATPQYDEEEEEEEEEETEVEEGAEDQQQNHPPLMYELIEAGTHVALRSSSMSSELFYICKVIEKKQAAEEMTDLCGHTIIKDEYCVKVNYLEVQSQKKDKVTYKYSKAPAALIHIGEISAAHVEMFEVGQYQCMPILEYNSLCADLFWFEVKGQQYPISFWFLSSYPATHYMLYSIN